MRRFVVSCLALWPMPVLRYRSAHVGGGQSARRWALARTSGAGASPIAPQPVDRAPTHRTWRQRIFRAAVATLLANLLPALLEGSARADGLANFDALRRSQYQLAPFVDPAKLPEPVPDSDAAIFGPEIVFGTETDSFPETVKLTFGVGMYCTGVLIDWRHVLTAAHCGCAVASSYQVAVEIRTDADFRHVVGPITGKPTLYASGGCDRPAVGYDLALLTVDLERVFHDSAGQPVTRLELQAARPPVSPAAPVPLLPLSEAGVQRAIAVGYGQKEDGSVTKTQCGHCQPSGHSPRQHWPAPDAGQRPDSLHHHPDLHPGAAEGRRTTGA